MTTYYDILGVEPTATAGEIKAAYRRLAMRFHPDRNVGANKAVQRLNEEKFKEIQEAYDTLKDEIKREEYDAAIEMLSSGEYYEPQPTPPPPPEKPRYCHKCRNPISTWVTAADEFCPFCGSPLQSSPPPPNHKAQRPPWHRQTRSTKQRASSRIPTWILVWLMLGAINSIIGPLSFNQDSSNPSGRQTNGNSQVIVKHTPGNKQGFEPVPQIIVPLVTTPYPPTITGTARSTAPQRFHSGRASVGEPKNRESNKTHPIAPATRAARKVGTVQPEAAREPRADNLSKLSWDDQQSLEAACAYDKTQGPAVYHRCLEDQLGLLATAPPMPDLSKLGRDDRQLLEAACAYDKTKGPAAYHRCVIHQLGQ